MPPSAVTAMPAGWASSACVAGLPSPVNPGVPVPATVVIVPSAETRRIRLLTVSAIRKPPSGSEATPCGAASCALVAGPPSPKEPADPVPATVVIVPSAATLRMQLLSASAIRKPPSGVRASPCGWFSWAAVAGPPSPL